MTFPSIAVSSIYNKNTELNANSSVNVPLCIFKHGASVAIEKASDEFVNKKVSLSTTTWQFVSNSLDFKIAFNVYIQYIFSSTLNL